MIEVGLQSFFWRIKCQRLKKLSNFERIELIGLLLPIFENFRSLTWKILVRDQKLWYFGFLGSPPSVIGKNSGIRFQWKRTKV